MPNQAERLLEYLQENREIGPLVAWRKLGIYRLSSTVYDLRKKGYAIESDKQPVFNQFGEKCHVALYRLSQGQAG